MGDLVGNIGMTRQGDNQLSNYYNSCPIIDNDGQFYQFEKPTAIIQSEEVGRLSSKQNLSSNIVQTFNDFEIHELLSSFTPPDIVDSPTLQTNRCLRGAGSACFTDLDCGPSFFTQKIFRNFDAELDERNLRANGYEIKYWQEELVCGQKAEKFSGNYDLKQNVCCRQTGKKLTIGNNDPDSSFGQINTRQVAGHDDLQYWRNCIK